MEMRLPLLPLWLAVGSQPGRIDIFFDRACGTLEHCLRGAFLGGGEFEAIEFEEANASHKASAFVAVCEGMIANDARCAQGCLGNHVGGTGVGVMLARTSEGGL